MSQLWKTFLVECKRRYYSFFELRDINIIQKEFNEKKWISKQELLRLYTSEIDTMKEVSEVYKKQLETAQREYSDLLKSFNLNAMQNYERLERKFQGLTKS